MTLKEIDRLEGLLAKATPEPWLRERFNGTSMQMLARGNEVVVYHWHHNRQNDVRLIDNMVLIEAMRFAFPELLVIARAALAASPPSGGDSK